ncbi:hypothetical protein CEXT_238911 [Caerostris extrusa]|uniref:Uncharacterized protein n=1 Tax=Caerostris extrusa TaxID=172846 RepID=A0AAV4R4Y7_CAEEX|nr:hypothetical protein CEXT_238911 [Caerostris extrusa]
MSHDIASLIVTDGGVPSLKQAFRVGVDVELLAHPLANYGALSRDSQCAMCGIPSIRFLSPPLHPFVFETVLMRRGIMYHKGLMQEEFSQHNQSICHLWQLSICIVLYISVDEIKASWRASFFLPTQTCLGMISRDPEDRSRPRELRDMIGP